ncbi:MAG: Stk1 family PASTA domain-containing Ser/Thr kinase [Solirubrobacteraceae bacterium]|nr:Stk1 family PASTA domain-containing Ser/Thr kinase [Solirubrobacteraceae bacterium]
MSQRIGPGSVIAGRYQVEAQIGVGGMALVYRAEDIQLGRKVAVKVLHGQYAEDAEFVERFRREAKAAAQLQHPGIVAIYDTGSWEGTWYIAMELLEGPTLKERIVAEGRIAPAEAMDLTDSILRAVRAAHRDGIIHRDIKPHNVILDDAGAPKVTDFGIARRGASDMTATGSILGTAHYIAPEQAQGEVITPRTDLYSVGVVLYEMLTGRTPFEGDTAVSIALAHVNNEPRSPRSIVPEISPALDAVVMRALAKRPADRFADADAFLAALADAKRGVAPVYTPGTGEHALAGAAAHERRAQADRRGTTGQIPVIGIREANRQPWYKRPWAITLLSLGIIAAVIAALLLGNTTRVTVPDVVNAEVATAQDVLEKQGFDVRVTTRISSARENTVVAQSPAAGEEREQGSVVRITVSKGAGTATVPEVSDQTLEVARDRIESAGFTTKVRREASEEIDSGNVIETSPSGGSIAQLNRPVTIVVSSGAKKVELPDLTGQPVDAARSQLAELGLVPSVVEQESAEREAGTVLSTDPKAGADVKVGDSVTVNVASEPTTETVPDVIGFSQSRATKALQAASFGVTTTTEDTDDESLDGKVISTDPAAGADRNKNAPVTIVIGRYTPPASTPEEGTTP